MLSRAFLRVIGFAAVAMVAPEVCVASTVQTPSSSSTSTRSVPSTRADESDVKPPLPLTTWRDLVDHPGRHVNKRLRLVLQFRTRVPTWSPYLTRFGTRDFVAYQFWGDEQRLWQIEEFQCAPVRLFARKQSLADWTLEKTQMYARFEVEISVREIFLDQPWAEIESVTPLDEHVSEGTLIHASRAIELMQSKSWKLAENEFDQALAGLLPPDAKRELENMRDECRRANDPKGREQRKAPSVLRGTAPVGRKS
jgi:hypothetical protein